MGAQYWPPAARVEVATAIDRGVTLLAPKIIDGAYDHSFESPRLTPMSLAVWAMSHRSSLLAMRTKEPLTDIFVESRTVMRPPPTPSRLPNL